MKSSQLHEISKTIEFIDLNLKEQISSNDILNQTWYSDFHFLRIFQQTTGFTLMEYLRKRRLSVAAEELCSKNSRVIDIAYNYYFGHEQTFIRVFKKEFGITPGKFRKNKINIHIFPKLSMQLLSKRTPRQFSVGRKMLLNHGICLIGLKRKVNYQENSLYSECKNITDDFINNWLHRISSYDERYMFGYDTKIPGDPENFYTIPCVAVPPETKVPNGMEYIKLPFHIAARTFCYFSRNLHDLINNDYEYIYKHIYDIYLPASHYRHSDPYDYVITDLSRQKHNSSTFSINLPVIEKV